MLFLLLHKWCVSQQRLFTPIVVRPVMQISNPIKVHMHFVHRFNEFFIISVRQVKSALAASSLVLDRHCSVSAL